MDYEADKILVGGNRWVLKLIKVIFILIIIYYFFYFSRGLSSIWSGGWAFVYFYFYYFYFLGGGLGVTHLSAKVGSRWAIGWAPPQPTNYPPKKIKKMLIANCYCYLLLNLKVITIANY